MDIILQAALAVTGRYSEEKRAIKREVDNAEHHIDTVVQQASDPSLWGGVGYLATIIGAFILLILIIFMIFMLWRR